MKITNALNAPVKPNPHGVKASPIYDTLHATAVHITLQPGESLKKHATPVDVFFYVLEGTVGFQKVGTPVFQNLSPRGLLIGPRL